MSVLTLSEKPVSAQLAAIRRGLPSNALTQVATALGMPKQRIIEGLKFAQRTISAREKNKTRFSSEESERILRVVKVRNMARKVFTSDVAVAEWMSTRKDYLDGQTPLAALETGIGASEVENLVMAMVHGVPL